MNFEPDIDLGHFVRRFFTCRGAEIESVGERLDVLAPRALARQLGIPSMSRLVLGSQDSDGLGVHFGSPLLEKIAKVACEAVPVCVVRLSFHYLKSQGFDRIAADSLYFPGCLIEVKSTAVVQTEYILLTCRYVAQSDEQKEGLLPLAFHLETGVPVDGIQTLLDAVEKQYESGGKKFVFTSSQLDDIQQWVERRALQVLEERLGPFRDSMNRRYRRDVTNLEEYYADLEMEMKGKLDRTGLSDQLIRERKEKIALIPEELEKKKDDLRKKYSIRVKFELSGVMRIHTPAVKLFCQAVMGRKKIPFSVYYNPITKDLDPLVCSGCGSGTYQAHFCDRSHLLCPSCSSHRQVCSNP